MKKDLQLKLVKDDRGSTMLEYALIAACISVVCIGALGFVGVESGKAFQTSGQTMYDAIGGGSIQRPLSGLPGG